MVDGLSDTLPLWRLRWRDGSVTYLLAGNRECGPLALEQELLSIWQDLLNNL